jgi:hypothetical protein
MTKSVGYSNTTDDVEWERGYLVWDEGRSSFEGRFPLFAKKGYKLAVRAKGAWSYKYFRCPETKNPIPGELLNAAEPGKIAIIYNASASAFDRTQCVSIGRSRESDVVVTGDSQELVSSTHLKVRVGASGRCEVRDENTKAGSAIVGKNGDRELKGGEWTGVASGDVVKIGNGGGQKVQVLWVGDWKLHY